MTTLHFGSDNHSSAPAPPPRRRCDCGDVDPILAFSAWEQMAASRATNDSDNGRKAGAKNGRQQRRPTVRIVQSETLDLRIFCGTWNVAGRMLEDGNDIAQWLDVDHLDSEAGKGQPPDIFVIGFQEVVELSAQNVVIDSFLDTQSRANSLKWFTIVYAFLLQYGHRHGVRYSMLSEQRLLGIYILAFAAEPVRLKIRHVQSAVVPTGLGGVFGNKGAVAISMEIAGTSSLCFVCVHMAAHRENVEARNAEYKLISSRPVFYDTSGRLQVADTPATLSVKDRQQSASWGSLFGVPITQSGVGSRMSPTRNAELKKAIRAATAFGLSRGRGGSTGGRSSQGDGRLQGDGSRQGLKASGTDREPIDADADLISDSIGTPRDGAVATYDLSRTKTVLEADIVFWLGDLNYRITKTVPDEAVFDMVARDDLETLRVMDQLNIARASGDAFQEFQEGPLCFPPSYKYIPGTKKLDNRTEKKVRCPSWTDRVLYSVGIYGGDAVRRLALDRYWSSSLLLSDHMPVSALFRTSFKCSPDEEIIEPDIEAEPLSPSRAAALAAYEATPFPVITLNPATVSVSIPATEVATEVKNEGGAAGEYHVCDDTVPKWIKLDNRRGTLAPGETTRLGIVVDAIAAAEEAAAMAGLLLSGSEHTRERPTSCAVLRVDVDGGGTGVLLPVVYTFDEVVVELT